MTAHNQTYGVKNPEGPRRFYVNQDAIGPDPVENWRVVIRVATEAFRAGGGIVYVPAGLYEQSPDEELPPSIQISGSNEV